MIARGLILLWAASVPRAHAQTVEGVDLSSLMLSLAVVIVMIIGVAFVIRRTPLGAASRADGPLKLVATLPLGPKERLLLIEVRGIEMLVAASPAGFAVVPARPSQNVAPARPNPGPAPEQTRADEFERHLALSDLG